MMKNKKFILFILGMLSLICNRMEVEGRPRPHRDGFHYTFTCDVYDSCDSNSGPVCGIDAAGFPRMFENRCLAELAYCREGRYYVEMKEGEC